MARVFKRGDFYYVDVNRNGRRVREATSSDVSGLRDENGQLKQLVAELSLKNRLLKKSLLGLE